MDRTRREQPNKEGVREAEAQLRVPCPLCGGPPLHPGTCVDPEGAVLPAYAELAEMWEDQGRPALTVEEMLDLEELLDVWGTEEERRA